MITDVKKTEGLGEGTLKKTIYAGAEAIMFNVLQESQYMYPFKSSVREIVSNSLDSITEKNNSLKILAGDIKIEDLYIEKEGEEYKDSRFDASYYDKKWLEGTSNDVTIIYNEAYSATRDLIQFIDYGVGLGGHRMISYFSLGFSSKRLNKSQLGSFGLGAKSLLATGIDYYTMTTFYNGKQFRFNIFKDHVVSDIPKFNEDKTENSKETFEGGFSCYYKKTTLKNHVIVESEVKKHRKKDYINAIESQLGYIENIKLWIKNEWGETEKKIKNKIIYKADNILMGESSYYSVPRLLLKPGDNSDICIDYGPINFDELEMPRVSGNVAFIMDIGSVNVTPSRESVIWNTKTREAIKNMYIDAQEFISTDVMKKLSHKTDFFSDFIYGISKHIKDPVYSELIKVIGLKTGSLKFKGITYKQIISKFDSFPSSILMTTTEANTNQYNSTIDKIVYKNSFDSKYYGFLCPANEDFNQLVFLLGDKKPTQLAAYAYKKFNILLNEIRIIRIKPEFYYALDDKYKDDEKALKEAYLEAINEKEFITLLTLDIYRAMQKSDNIIFDEDVNGEEYKEIVKKVEETAQKVNVAKTYGQSQLAAGKLKLTRLEYLNGGYTVYETLDTLKFNSATGNIGFTYEGDPTLNSLIDADSYMHFPRNYIIYKVSVSNYKEIIKSANTKSLSELLYTINFGDIELSKLGLYIVKTYLSGNEKGLKKIFPINKAHFNIKKEEYKEDITYKVTRTREKLKLSKLAKSA